MRKSQLLKINQSQQSIVLYRWQVTSRPHCLIKTSSMQSKHRNLHVNHKWPYHLHLHLHTTFLVTIWHDKLSRAGKERTRQGWLLKTQRDSAERGNVRVKSFAHEQQPLSFYNNMTWHNWVGQERTELERNPVIQEILFSPVNSVCRKY